MWKVFPCDYVMVNTDLPLAVVCGRQQQRQLAHTGEHPHRQPQEDVRQDTEQEEALAKNTLVLSWCLARNFLGEVPGPKGKTAQAENSRPCLNIKTVFPRYVVPMLKIDRLIFNHGDPYAGKTTSLYWDGPQKVFTL